MKLGPRILEGGLLFGLLLMGTVDVQAAKAPVSLKEMKKKATHIISGRVLSVTSRIQRSEIEKGLGVHRDKVFTITLKVASVSTGDGVKPDDDIVIEAWKPSTRIPPLPGLQGHVPIPEKGDIVTVYVVRRKGKAFEPFLPNGMQIKKNRASQVAREHVRNFLEGDFNKMEKSYAGRIVLMPGNEFLKAKYGLAGAKGEKEAITVDRARLIGTMKKSLHGRPPVPANIVDKVFDAYVFEPLTTKVGDFATVPPDPVDTADGRLHFTIADGDVLFKVGPKKGDFLLFQFRRIEGRWKVVAEYLD